MEKSSDRGKFVLDNATNSCYNGFENDAKGGKNVDYASFMSEIQVATAIARRQSEAVYGYYLPKRPPAPGAHPNDAILMVTLEFRTWHEIICEDIWGWVCYARPLTSVEVAEYELLPDEDNPFRYQQYGLVRRIRTEDEGGRRMLRREYVRGDDGKPFITSYPRKALILLEKLKKEADGDLVVKMVKFAQKETTDVAPT